MRSFMAHCATVHFQQDEAPASYTEWKIAGKCFFLGVDVWFSASKFQWKVQHHGLNHDTAARYWRYTMEREKVSVCGGNADKNRPRPHVLRAN